MKFSGHSDRDVLREAYASSLLVDGQASYWNEARQTELIEAFRGMSLQWHPSMIHSLPAKVQDDLRCRPDFVAFDEEFRSLGERLEGLTVESDIQAATVKVSAARRGLSCDMRGLPPTLTITSLLPAWVVIFTTYLNPFFWQNPNYVQM
jgi:hypothetical protein